MDEVSKIMYNRYLNSSTPYALYQGEANQPYFVDKSLLLTELFHVLDAGNQHVCITRPRRFGKTIMANMIAAFLSKKVDSDSIKRNIHRSKFTKMILRQMC